MVRIKIKRLFIVVCLFIPICPLVIGGDDCCDDPFKCTILVRETCCLLTDELYRFGDFIRGPNGYHHNQDTLSISCRMTFMDCPPTEDSVGTKAYMDYWCRDDQLLPQSDVYCFGWHCCCDNTGCFQDNYRRDEVPCCSAEVIAECVVFRLGTGWSIFDSDRNNTVDLRDYAFLQNQFRR